MRLRKQYDALADPLAKPTFRRKDCELYNAILFCVYQLQPLGRAPRRLFSPPIKNSLPKLVHRIFLSSESNCIDRLRAYRTFISIILQRESNKYRRNFKRYKFTVFLGVSGARLFLNTFQRFVFSVRELCAYTIETITVFPTKMKIITKEVHVLRKLHFLR